MALQGGSGILVADSDIRCIIDCVKEEGIFLGLRIH